MKAMIIKEIGTTEVFQLVEKARPVAKAGHIVVAVKATSVNPLNTMLRSIERLGQKTCRKYCMVMSLGCH